MLHILGNKQRGRKVIICVGLPRTEGFIDMGILVLKLCKSQANQGRFSPTKVLFLESVLKRKMTMNKEVMPYYQLL